MSHISFIRLMPNIYRQPTVIASLASFCIHGIMGLGMPISSAQSKIKQPYTKQIGTVSIQKSTSEAAESISPEAFEVQPMNIPSFSAEFIKLPPIPQPYYQSTVPQIDKDYAVVNLLKENKSHLQRENKSKVQEVIPPSSNRGQAELKSSNYIAYRISKHSAFKNKQFSSSKQNRLITPIQTIARTPAVGKLDVANKITLNQASSAQLSQISEKNNYMSSVTQSHRSVFPKTNFYFTFVKLPIVKSSEQIISQKGFPVIIANNNAYDININNKDNEEAKKKNTDLLLAFSKLEIAKNSFVSQNYPQAACAKKLEDTVIIRTVVDVNGKSIQEPQLIRSSEYDILNQQAINDVKGGYFHNITKDSQPYLINVLFKYNKRTCPDFNVSSPLSKDNDNAQSFWWQYPTLKIGRDWKLGIS